MLFFNVGDKEFDACAEDKFIDMIAIGVDKKFGVLAGAELTEGN